jgi:hypothetical protein
MGAVVTASSASDEEPPEPSPAHRVSSSRFLERIGGQV